jgi:hypothetical protein
MVGKVLLTLPLQTVEKGTLLPNATILFSLKLTEKLVNSLNPFLIIPLRFSRRGLVRK